MSDSDLDNLSDELELRLGTDPFRADTDGDGVSDFAERRLGTDPTRFDTDGDGVGDGAELARRRDPLHPDPPHPLGVVDRPFPPTADDADGDGLGTAEERLLGTNAGEADTDGDGLSDWVESIRGTNPRSTSSTGGRTSDLDEVAAELRAVRGRAPGETIAGEHGRHAFLDAARSQLGDPYRFGAEARLDDPDPEAFDSSELVEWAAAQAGITLPDGSWRQYRHLHEGGNAVSVGDALRTPGALVFGFSSDPLASAQRPARAFVAISLGDGTVIDVSERAGEVRVMEAGPLFTHAAVIPELMERLDSDGDGLPDELERDHDSDPFDPSDDLRVGAADADVSPEPGGDETFDALDRSALDVPLDGEPAFEELTFEASALDEPAFEELTFEASALDEPAFEELTFEEPAFDEPAFDEPALAGAAVEIGDTHAGEVGTHAGA